MKKAIFNFLLVISLSFVLVTNVHAADSDLTEIPTIEITTTGGTSHPLYAEGEVPNLTCNKKEIGPNYVEVASGYKMKIHSGRYYVYVDNGAKDTEIKCTYSDGVDSSLTTDHRSGAGTFNYKVKISDKVIDEDYTVKINLNAFSDTERRITGPNSPFSSISVDSIKSCTVEDNSKKYIGCSDLNNVGYGVFLKDENPILEKPVEVSAVINLKDKRKITVIAKINNETTIMAYFGGATCKFDGTSWKNVTYEKGTRKDTDIKDKDHTRELVYRGGNITLPSPKDGCTWDGDKGAGEYEFQGWYIQPGGTDVTTASDVCTNHKLYSGSVNYSDIIKENKDMSIQYNRSLVACFKQNTNYVELNLGHSDAKLDDTSASAKLFKQVNSDKMSTIYRAYLSDSTIQLPNVVFTSDKVDNQFHCWIKNGTDKCIDSDTVGPGQYNLAYTTKPYIGDVIDIDKDVVLAATSNAANGVSEGENLNIATYLDRITSCTSKDTNYVKTKFTADKSADDMSGTCSVEGIKETTGDRVVVEMKGFNGNKSITVNVHVRVIKDSAVSGSEAAYSVYTGNPYSVTGFLENANKSLDDCVDYSISPHPDYDKGNGYTIINYYKFTRDGKSKKAKIIETVYQGELACNGEVIKVAAVCLDPARQEPTGQTQEGFDGNIRQIDSKNPYYLDHRTMPSNNYVDNLTIVAYSDPNYKRAIAEVATSDGSKKISSESREKMAALTLAYRVMTLKIGEDAKNKASGLQDQYYGYRAIMGNINRYWNVVRKDKNGNPIKDKNGNTVLDTYWGTYVRDTNNDVKNRILHEENYAYNLFCVHKKDMNAKNPESNDPSNCEEPVDRAVLKDAALLLYNALIYNPGDFSKLNISAYVSETSTSDFQADGRYTKKITGKVVGIPTDASVRNGHFLSILPTCETCNQYGVQVTLKIGRDKAHLVDYDPLMNVFETLYGDIAGYENDTTLKDKHLFDETDGSLTYEYTIHANYKNIANKIKEYNNSGKYYDETAGANRSKAGYVDLSNLKVTMSVGIDGDEYRTASGQANSKVNANFQRMEVLHNISAESRWKTDGKPSSSRDTGTGAAKDKNPCGASNSCNFSLNAEPSVKIDYNPGKLNKMIINYTHSDISSFLPTCDSSIAAYDYKKCGADSCPAEFEGELFAGAGCCTRVLDETSYVFKTYCSNKCVQTTYSPVCKTVADPTKKSEEFNIKEATQPDGKENYTCIVDPNKEKTKDEKVDAKGNHYALDAFKNNSLCTVSCKEDWNFTMPTINNHIGANAVRAGSYFAMDSDRIDSSGKRTCVTTNLNLEDWSDTIEDYSEKLVYAFNYANIDQILDDHSASLWSDIKVEETKHEYCKDSEYAFKTECTKQDSNGNYTIYTTSKSSCNSDEVALGCACRTSTERNKGVCKNGEAPSACYDIKVIGPEISPIPVVHYNNGTISNGSFTYNGYTETITNFKGDDDTGKGECSDGDIQRAKDYDKSHIAEKMKAEIKSFANYWGGGNPPEREWTWYQTEIRKLIDDMKVCQFWGLEVSNTNLIREDHHALYRIITSFDPSISYQYDEKEFMDQIAGNNIMKTEDVNYVFSYNYYKQSGFNLQSYTGTSVGSNSSSYITDDNEKNSNALIEGSGLTDLNNQSTVGEFFKQNFIVCHEAASGTYKTQGNKIGAGGGKVVSYDREASCDPRSEEYIKDADYIKRSVEAKTKYYASQKFFVDEETGFIQAGTCTKECVNTNSGVKKAALEAAQRNAISRAQNGSKNYASWKPYATSSESDALVFPVSETTPRNMYQYSFTFNNLGNFNNKSGLGRLMGTADSVYANNSRVCFYEVVEGICYCCGDTLETELVYPSGSSTREIIAKDENGNNTSGKNLTNDSYMSNYKMSKSIKNDDDLAKTKEQSIYNVKTNTVSLNSIKEDAGRPLGANWSDNQHYILEGYTYVTPKGAQLLNNIEDAGDTVYELNGDIGPEYSYTLSPTALSSIRNQNERKGYQEQNGTMTLVGFTKMVSNGNRNWNVQIPSASSPTTDAGFGHYASNFLTNTVSAFVTEEYKDSVLSRLPIDPASVCYVIDYGDKGFVFGSNGNVFNGNGPVVDRTKCRWIDYVGLVQKSAIDDTANNAGDLDDGNHYYRLSFK